MTSIMEDFLSKVLKRREVSLYIMYGNTEGCMLAIYQLLRGDKRFITGTCGRVSPGVEIKVRGTVMVECFVQYQQIVVDPIT